MKIFILVLLILLPFTALALSQEEKDVEALCREHWSNTRVEKYDIGFEKCNKIYPALLEKSQTELEKQEYKEDKKERSFLEKFSEENDY